MDDMRLTRLIKLSQIEYEKTLKTILFCNASLYDEKYPPGASNATFNDQASMEDIYNVYEHSWTAFDESSKVNNFTHNLLYDRTKSDLKELLSYTCDRCLPGNETNIKLLWDFEICPHPVNTVFHVAVYFFYALILVTALAGNFMVVFIVAGTAKMRTVTNYFIVNMAVGDICMALFCIPFTTVTTLVLQYWPFGLEMCIVVNYLQAVTVFVSAYSLVAISMDRYLAIMYPLRPRMTRLQARLIIVLVWLLSMFTTSPQALFSHLYVPEENQYRLYNRKVCGEDWQQYTTEQKTGYSAALMLLQYVLPVVVLLFTYIRIGSVVWGKRNIGETPARHERVVNSKRKTVKMMVVVVTVYTLCWLPFNVLMVVRDLDSSVDMWPGMIYMWTAFHWLAMSHTCYNPLILCWMNNKFQSRFCYIGYHIPCLRGFIDKKCRSTHQQQRRLTRASTFTSTHESRLSSRTLVAIPLQDDSIVFKSRYSNGEVTNTRANTSSTSDSHSRFFSAAEDMESESVL